MGDEKSPTDDQPPATEGDEKKVNKDQPPTTEGDEIKPNEEQTPATVGDEDFFESPNDYPVAEEVKQLNVDQELKPESAHGPREILNDGSDGKGDVNDPRLGKDLYVDYLELPLIIDVITFAFSISDN